MNQTAIVFQVRTGSTRLPQKVTRPFFGNDSMLDIMLQRVRKAFPESKVVVATTTASADDPIEVLAGQYGVNVFRGDEEDVLHRFIQACEVHDVSKLIRVCGDNPFLSMTYLRDLLDCCTATPGIDYGSFKYRDGTPSILSHSGLLAEYVSLDCMQSIYRTTKEQKYREHLTSYVLDHLDEFESLFLPVPVEIESRPFLRLTVDTLEDFKVTSQLYALCLESNTEFGCEQLWEVVDDENFKNQMRIEIRKNQK